MGLGVDCCGERDEGMCPHGHQKSSSKCMRVFSLTHARFQSIVEDENSCENLLAIGVDTHL